MGHGCSFLAKGMMGTECLSKMGWGLHLMPDMDLLQSEHQRRSQEEGHAPLRTIPRQKKRRV